MFTLLFIALMSKTGVASDNIKDYNVVGKYEITQFKTEEECESAKAKVLSVMLADTAMVDYASKFDKAGLVCVDIYNGVRVNI